MVDVQVRGRFLDADDTPARGDITFTPRVRAANDTTDGNILVGARVRVTLDAAGEFAVILQASDDAGIDPTGWTYRVVEEFVRVPARSYDIDVPAAAAVAGIDLVDVAPAPESAGEPTAFVTLAAFTAAVAGRQPLDADLTAIAGLATTAYGRSFLDRADAAAGRTLLGLGTAATAPSTAFDPAGSAAAAQAAAIAASQPLDADLTAIAALSTTAFGRSLLALADAAAARTTLAIVPETTTFLSGSGNYQIPAWAMAAPTTSYLRAQLQAGGSGGGSGRQGAAGTVRCGGGPGAAGGYTDVTLLVSDVLSAYPSGLVPYTIGAGGAGGAAQASPDSNGNAGTGSSGHTFIGANLATSIASAFAGGTGAGGTATTGTAGFAAYGSTYVLTPTSASTSGGPGANTSRAQAGPGGGITSGNVPGAGSSSASGFSGGTSATGGVVDGALPTAGVLSGTFSGPGPGPGGGAASITQAAQAGANALPNSGAGGGGGGASLNGNNSGAGGNGGSGYLRITVSPA